MSKAPSATVPVPEQASLLRRLTLVDSLMLLVGGIAGSAIFMTARDVARALPSPAMFLLVWVIGGAVSLLACFAFAELGAMYPEAGGQYVYLREAYGELTAFLYGWMYFSVVGSGSVGIIAVACASYLGVMMPVLSERHIVWNAGTWQVSRTQVAAIGIIALVTLINVLGVKRAAVLQNIATWLKYAAMLGFAALGLALGSGSWSHFHATPATASAPLHGWALISGFGVALIAVFWAYDGWVYIGQAAGEVQRPERNIPLALIGGILMVAVIYIAINATYLFALPLNAIASGESTTAEAAAAVLFSSAAGWWMSALVAVSCLGALSSAVLTGARVSYALAADGQFFRALARVHPRWRTPALALVVQAIWSSILALSGRYDQLFTFLMFVQVLSYALAVAGVVVLRRKRPQLARPYRCPGYPWVPALYCVTAVAWAGNTLWQSPRESLYGVAIVVLGLPGYFYWRRARPAAGATQPADRPQSQAAR